MLPHSQLEGGVGDPHSKSFGTSKLHDEAELENLLEVVRQLVRSC